MHTTSFSSRLWLRGVRGRRGCTHLPSPHPLSPPSCPRTPPFIFPLPKCMLVTSPMQMHAGIHRLPTEQNDRHMLKQSNFPLILNSFVKWTQLAQFDKTSRTWQSFICVSVFKIRLIILGFLPQKTKIPVFELTTYWFSIGSLNHYTTEPTVRGRHIKAFSSLQSCLTDSSWIHLILLIQLI